MTPTKPIPFEDLTESQKMLMLSLSVNEMHTQLSDYRKLFFEGKDGELPYLERIRNLEAFVGGTKFWMRTIAVAIVIQTITFGVAAIVYAVRLYPLLEKLTTTIP